MCNEHSCHSLQVANVLYWHFISKAVELLDTVLMILRKKDNQVTFLHVYHHVLILNTWWWVMKFIPGGVGECQFICVALLRFFLHNISVVKIQISRFVNDSMCPV